MNEIFYKFEDFISEASINNFLKTLIEMVELDPSFVDFLLTTYIEIIENFRNQVLVKVSSWIIGEMTHQICTFLVISDLRDKNSEVVDRSVDALLSCADEYIENQMITMTIVTSLMKLSPIEMTSKHE